MPNKKADKAYEVGYKRPPESGQFKPGRSGNPKGRPKGSRNFSTQLDAELRKKVTITENGRTKRVRKMDVAAMQFVNKAAGGDIKMLSALLQHDRLQGIAATEEAPALSRPFDAQEQEVLSGLYERLQQHLEYQPAQTASDAAADKPRKHRVRLLKD